MKKKLLREENQFLTIGILFAVFTFKFLLIPSGINIGGFAGISQLLNKTCHIPFFVSTLVLNGALYIWGMNKKGLVFVGRSIATTALFSILLDIPLNSSTLTLPLWITAILSAVGAGLGFGLILSGNSSTGGSDLLGAIVAAYFPRVSVGSAMIAANIAIILMTGLSTGLIYGTKLFFISISTTVLSNILIDVVYCYNTGQAPSKLIQYPLNLCKRIFGQKPTRLQQRHTTNSYSIPSPGDRITVEVNGSIVTFLVTDVKSQ